MLPTRDPTQSKRPTKTESKGLQKKYFKQTERKIARVAILVSHKVNFKTRGIKREPEGHFTVLRKESIKKT